MKKVLCMGEALIDMVSLNKGKSLKDTSEFVKKAGGAPANVAGAISKLGAKAYFCGSVGDDSFGKFLEETFNKNDIDTSLMFKLKDRSTTLAFVSLMEDGERDFEFKRDADAILNFNDIEDRLSDFDLFHFGSATAFLGGELKESYYKLKDYALESNKFISFDANYREALFHDKKEEFIKCSKEFIAISDIVKLSDEEALLISGEKDIEVAGKELVKLACKNLIITLGSKGSMLTTLDKQILVPTKEVKMKDSTGAGDAFIGAVLVEFLENKKSMEEIISFANLVGGITTTKLGALESIPTREEVQNYLV